MTQQRDQFEHVAEQTAKHLLERAATLDSDRVSLAELRDAAAESGISPTAFDAAVAEWRAGPETSMGKPLLGRIGEAVLRNAAALSSGYVAAAALAVGQRLIAAPWLVHKLTDPVGLAVGALVAVRLRARTATVVLGGLAVSQSAEFLMDLISGRPAIHGAGAHIGLMIAGIAGVALGTRFLRWSNDRGKSNGTDGGTLHTQPNQQQRARMVGSANSDADRQFMEFLPLRRASSEIACG